MAEAFTDPESFAGTCYKASGWEAARMTQGHSRHRADFHILNGRPKRLWMKELGSGARQEARALHLDDTLEKALTPAPNGMLPMTSVQSHSLLEVLRTVKDPRAFNTRFRIGPIPTLVVMALLSGARDVAQIARFATRLRPQQRAALALPLKKGTRRFCEVPGYSVFYTCSTGWIPRSWLEAING